ncbi:unnamed protein product [Jaminaea pallidilutea]
MVDVSLPSTSKLPDGNGASPAMIEGEEDPKKLTPSCSRCRLKKLKCDTEQPCSNCIAKGLEHECKKDQRVPRGKKRSKPDRAMVQEEMTQLQRRMEHLQRMLPKLASGSPGSSPSDSTTTPATPLDAPRPSKQPKRTNSSFDASRSSDPLRPWIGPYDAGDSSKREIDWRLSGGMVDSETKAAATQKQPAVETWMIDVVHSHWADPANFQARVDLSREAKTLMPSTIIIEELIDTFFLSCNHLVGGIIFEPRFRRLSAVSYKSNLSTEEILTSPLYIDPSCWVMLFMVLSIGLCFYPFEMANPTPAFHAVNSLRASEGEKLTERMHDFSRRCLAVGETLELTSLPAIQSAILMCFRAKEKDSYTRQLLRLVISSAQNLGYHRLGAWKHHEGMRLEDRVRKEIITRVWAHLCTRDWCAIARDGNNVIRPWQCDTRQPSNLSTSDILACRDHSRPISEVTDMSYSLAMLGLSKVIREMAEERFRSGEGLTTEVRDRYTKQIYKWYEGLPQPLRLDQGGLERSSPSVPGWLLLTQGLHQLLRLHRHSLVSRSTRQALLPLATAWLEAYPHVADACPVIGILWSNWMQAVATSFVLSFELMDPSTDQSKQHNKKHPSQYRNTVRMLIYRAHKALLNDPNEHGSVVLQSLLEMEEERSQSQSQSQSAEIKVSDLDELNLEVLRRSARSSGRASVTSADLTFPAKGHDAVLPALSTASDGNRHCDILRVEDWIMVAEELSPQANGNEQSGIGVNGINGAQSAGQNQADLLTAVGVAYAHRQKVSARVFVPMATGIDGHNGYPSQPTTAGSSPSMALPFSRRMSAVFGQPPFGPTTPNGDPSLPLRSPSAHSHASGNTPSTFGQGLMQHRDPQGHEPGSTVPPLAPLATLEAAASPHRQALSMHEQSQYPSSPLYHHQHHQHHQYHQQQQQPYYQQHPHYQQQQHPQHGPQHQHHSPPMYQQHPYPRPHNHPSGPPGLEGSSQNNSNSNNDSNGNGAYPGGRPPTSGAGVGGMPPPALPGAVHYNNNNAPHHAGFDARRQQQQQQQQGGGGAGGPPRQLMSPTYEVHTEPQHYHYHHQQQQQQQQQQHQHQQHQQHNMHHGQGISTHPHPNAHQQYHHR